MEMEISSAAVRHSWRLVPCHPLWGWISDHPFWKCSWYFESFSEIFLKMSSVLKIFNLLSDLFYHDIILAFTITLSDLFLSWFYLGIYNKIGIKGTFLREIFQTLRHECLEEETSLNRGERITIVIVILKYYIIKFTAQSLASRVPSFLLHLIPRPQCRENLIRPFHLQDNGS